MLQISSININGSCKEANHKSDVAYFSASYSDNGSFTVNKNVMDKEIYEANKEQIDADFADFEQKVMQYIQNISMQE